MARAATVALAVVSIVLGILFKGQNVAYMVGLAFAIAASANFPVLVLSIFWSRLTTAGAQASTIVGTVSALVLIWLSPAIQIDVLKHEAAWFPLRNPGIVTHSAGVRGGDAGVVAPPGARRGARLPRARAPDSSRRGIASASAAFR